MLKTLVAAGIKSGYTVCSAVPLLMREVSKVIIGASAVLGNGAILSRVGNSVVCNAAKERQVPVIVVCESYKFLDETRLDSFTWNEIGMCAWRPRSLHRQLNNIIPSAKAILTTWSMSRTAGHQSIRCTRLRPLHRHKAPVALHRGVASTS